MNNNQYLTYRCDIYRHGYALKLGSGQVSLQLINEPCAIADDEKDRLLLLAAGLGVH